ncbi:MAG: SIR2 family protein [Candidatus Saganbacteria bacterium]|nr:SIR2 family protein [Candidatus Saganbacteria bacterium]
MKTVYVMGAGASTSSPNQDTATGKSNPVDSSFWQTVEELNLLNSFPLLNKFLDIIYCGRIGIGGIKIGMEAVYTLVDNYISILAMGEVGIYDHFDETDCFGRKISLIRHVKNNKDLWGAINAYSDAVNMANSQTTIKCLVYFRQIETELIELIYAVFFKINKGWNCPLHNNFLSNIIDKENEATIISFNYDLLIDGAFAQQKYIPNVDFSYYLWFHRFSGFLSRDLKHKEIIVRRIQREPPGDRIELIKLHGSLNWFVLMDKGEPKHTYFQAIGDLEYVPETNRVYSLRFEYEEGSQKNLTLKRAIMPPILGKLKKFKDKISFESLWSRALEKLINCDEIVFVGYSLPVADFMAEWLFRTAYTLSSNKKNVVQIINPDPKVAERLGNIYFQANISNNFKDFNKYVESL